MHNLALKVLFYILMSPVCNLMKHVGLQDNSKVVAEVDDSKMAEMVCSLTNRDECLACGS